MSQTDEHLHHLIHLYCNVVDNILKLISSGIELRQLSHDAPALTVILYANIFYLLYHA